MQTYYDTILKQLREGVPEERIAADFTRALNKARDDFHGKELYDKTQQALREAWNDAIDAYALYKGIPEGLNKKDLYLMGEDDIIESIVPVYDFFKTVTENVNAIIPSWRDQVGSK